MYENHCANLTHLFSISRCLDGLITTQAELYLQASLEGWWAEGWCVGNPALLQLGDLQAETLKKETEVQEKEEEMEDWRWVRLLGLLWTTWTLFNNINSL